MREKYTGFSYAVYYTAVFLLISFSLISGAVRENTAAMLIFMLLAMVCGVGVMILASRIPCRICTDEKGFTITEMGIKNRFEYDSVKQIDFEFVYARYGALIQLTINDESMGESVFREICSEEQITDLLACRESGNRPRLTQLCEFVKQVKEAGS